MNPNCDHVLCLLRNRETHGIQHSAEKAIRKLQATQVPTNALRCPLWFSQSVILGFSECANFVIGYAVPEDSLQEARLTVYYFMLRSSLALDLQNQVRKWELHLVSAYDIHDIPPEYEIRRNVRLDYLATDIPGISLVVTARELLSETSLHVSVMILPSPSTSLRHDGQRFHHSTTDGAVPVCQPQARVEFSAYGARLRDSQSWRPLMYHLPQAESPEYSDLYLVVNTGGTVGIHVFRPIQGRFEPPLHSIVQQDFSQEQAKLAWWKTQHRLASKQYFNGDLARSMLLLRESVFDAEEYILRPRLNSSRKFRRSVLQGRMLGFEIHLLGHCVHASGLILCLLKTESPSSFSRSESSTLQLVQQVICLDIQTGQVFDLSDEHCVHTFDRGECEKQVPLLIMKQVLQLRNAQAAHATHQRGRHFLHPSPKPSWVLSDEAAVLGNGLSCIYHPYSRIFLSNAEHRDDS